MAKHRIAPKGKPAPRGRANSKPTAGGTPPRAIAMPSAFDPFALDADDANARGKEDNWRTPLETGDHSFADLAKMISDDPDEAVLICQKTLKTDHVAYWGAVYRVIALGIVWARILMRDDEKWRVFKAMPFWRGHRALNRQRALNYCLMVFYGAHQGNPAHRANDHAGAVKKQANDENFAPRDLPRVLFSRGGLESKKAEPPVKKSDSGLKSPGGNPAAVAASQKRASEAVKGTAWTDDTATNADDQSDKRPVIKLPKPSGPGAPDPLATALFNFVCRKRLALMPCKTLYIEVTNEEDTLEDLPEDKFTIIHKIY